MEHEVNGTPDKAFDRHALYPAGQHVFAFFITFKAPVSQCL